MGCYRDDSTIRAVPDLERTDPVLDGNYRVRQSAVEKCAIVARKRGFRMFAIQHHGQCLSSATATARVINAVKTAKEGLGQTMFTHLEVGKISSDTCAFMGQFAIM